jgi:N-acetylmuramoyl-L-alanine amidase
MHKSEESLRVAMRENASMFKEEGYESNYDGFDPNDPDTYIALALRQNVNLDASLTLGAAIQTQFRDRVGRRDRGVKQAGFYVISYTTMPSTLVELGFLTNPEEEDFLQSENGKAYLASAIYRAFRDTYLASRKVGQAPEPSPTPQPAPDPEPTPPPQENVAQAAESGPEVWFGVQILTTESALSPSSPELRGHSEAKPYIRHGLHKYVTGHYMHPDQAHEAKTALRAEGFEGAFVVAFEGETQIPMSRARDLLNLPLQ